MSYNLDRDKLLLSIRHRSDEASFERCIQSIPVYDLDPFSILDNCGLERALWSLRALRTDEHDGELRLFACEVVENALNREREYHAHIEDEFPFNILKLTRNYIDRILTSEEVKEFESRITYARLMKEADRRWAKIDSTKFPHSLTRAAVETTDPDAKLSTYFAVLTANNHNTPEIRNENQAFKELKLRELAEFV